MKGSNENEPVAVAAVRGLPVLDHKNILLIIFLCFLFVCLFVCVVCVRGCVVSSLFSIVASASGNL